MTTINIAPCPLCGSTTGQMIEPSMYAQEGKYIFSAENRTDWIVKCTDCHAITPPAHSKAQAIIYWNKNKLRPLSYILQGPNVKGDMEPYQNLLIAIYKTAFDDYKEALRRKRETGGRGRIEGDHWLMEQNPIFKRTALEQIPYDQWRDKMNCTHCAIKEADCPHKNAYPWIQFKNGKLHECPRRKGDDLL